MTRRLPALSPAIAKLACALALLGVAVLLTVAARTRPSFDAYGWLDWGRMTWHGGLDTNAAPSWKPLPYLFTVVYGLLGRGPELWLWMVTVTAVSLLGLGWAGALAWRLSGSARREEAPGSRAPGSWASGSRAPRAIAAGLAVAGLLAIHDEYAYGTFAHYVLSAQTDPMIVACVLGAIDCQLRGHVRVTFGLLVLAALGRPEAWPFLAADAWWLWRARPGFRWALVAGGAAIGLLWFGVPALTSRSWFVAGDNADASGFGPTGNRALGVLGRYVIQMPWPLQATAGLAVAVALWQRRALELGLAASVVVWIAIEVAFGLHGWPALGRYMFEPAAVEIVLAAGLVGRWLGAVAGAVGRSVGAGRSPAAGRSAAAGRSPAAGSVTTTAAGAVLAAAAIGGSIPFFIASGRAASRDLSAQHTRTDGLTALGRTIARVGGAELVRRCGEVISDGLETQTVLAFDVGENVNRVGFKLDQPGHPRNPIVVFTPHGTGWSVRVARQTRPACRAIGRGG